MEPVSQLAQMIGLLTSMIFAVGSYFRTMMLMANLSQLLREQATVDFNRWKDKDLGY